MKTTGIYTNLALLLSICCGIVLNSALAQSGEFQNFSASKSVRHRITPIDGIFSTQFTKDSTLSHRFDTELNDWMLAYRYTYEYDQQGREVQINRSNLLEGVWKPSSRSINSFGNGQLITSELHQKALVGAGMVDSLQRSFSYDYRDRIQEESTHIYSEGKWNAKDQIGYSYNFEGLLLQELTALWSMESNSWVNSSRLQFEYTEDKQLSREVLQLWNATESVWLNESSRDFEYSYSDLLISSKRSKWDSVQGEWILIGVTSIEYNEEGQVKSTEHVEVSQNSGPLSFESENADYDENGNLEEFIQSSWNETEANWDSYLKQNHYWSEHQIGNQVGNAKDVHCTFSNPYTIGLPWYCSSLKTDVLYTISVYDLLGRQFYQGKFLGQHTFTIADQIPSGFYVVSIQGGLDQHTEKILIR